MIQKIFLIIWAVVLFPFVAQSQHFELNGVVLNGTTSSPIENVNLKIRNSQAGTISDNNGKFKLELKKLPVILEVSCIGYESISIEITNEIKTPFEIILLPSVEQLEGVTISAQKVIPVFEDRNYSVIDYEIMGENLLLLVYKYQLKRSLLLLLTRSGDTLSQAVLPEIPPAKLYKDILGNVHYFSKKGNAYQCFYDQSTRILLFPYNMPVDSLLRTIGNFRFAMNNRIYFQEEQPDGFSTLLGYFEKTSGKTYLQYAGDPSAAKNHYDDLNYFMQPRRPDDLNQNMTDFQMRAFEMFYKPKIVASMVKTSPDRIAVFNFMSDSVKVRDSTWKLIQAAPLAFRNDTKKTILTNGATAYSGDLWKWRWSILTDESSGKVYTVFEKRGHQKLCNIDLTTGNISAEYELPVLFAEKISVYKGEAFFLYKPIGENEKWRLYKMKL
jgi:hypothetical protein